VLMKDVVTPVPQEEVKAVIRKCLEQAAIVNYQRLSEYAKLEGKKREMYEHPVFCLASQVMDLTIQNVGRLVTPAKKLEDTIRLSELVIEVLQQNEEHHAEGREAFAWWSDLMVEHAETFLCLYSADMDAALEIQPPDSWDSFPLFQLLNDFLRVDYNLCNGKFHKHLQDLYAPLVVRYVDLMESSIAQSIHRGFERESWEPVNNGSATSEDLFWKLDALQTFIKDLHWPEEEFGKHLETRLKLMSSDMIESCIKRTRAAFEAKLQRSSRTTDFRVPQSICTMFNVMVDAKSQSAKLCVVDLSQERQYHSQIDHLIEETVKEMITILVAKFVVILESVLSKLSRYDEGTLFSSFLSFTVKAASKYVDVPKPGMDVADSYVTFIRHSQDMLREKVNEEIYVERLFDVSWNKRVDYEPGTGSKQLFPKMHLETCGEPLSSLRVTVELQTSHIGKGCDRETYSEKSLQKLCGASSGSTDLLPAPGGATNWTASLVSDSGRDSDLIFRFDGRQAAKIPDWVVPQNLTDQFTIATWMKHGPSPGLRAEKETLLCNSDKTAYSSVTQICTGIQSQGPFS
ncbi:PREDICTED: calcium-dependent secretion activator 1-like, partial [Cyprinodon variegatus]|uniref:calcium-dependent secretion activator 1-like n=1 Tax=Cyprinodon variegatus TaxID=28743 RepID=UPI00074270F9